MLPHFPVLPPAGSGSWRLVARGQWRERAAVVLGYRCQALLLKVPHASPAPFIRHREPRSPCGPANSAWRLREGNPSWRGG